MKNSFRADVLAATLAILAMVGCQRREPAGWQGYLEGEFVQVAAPLGGRLERLDVQRGARVEAGATLFTLEHASEKATQREASDRLRAAEARLEDLKKGYRPSELAAWCRAADLELTATRGMEYNPLTERYWLSEDTSVNYLFACRKPA